MSAAQTQLAWDTMLDLGGPAGSPLHRRLAGALRAAIETGRLAPGAMLPPTRLLAEELHCSRWAVTEAYEQLTAEGFVEARVGSGTRVRAVPRAATLAEHARDARAAAGIRYDITPGMPDLAAFPARDWMAALRTAITRATAEDLGQPRWGGHQRLRDVLSGYLARVRGAATSAASLRITTGIADGVGLTGAILYRHGFRAVGVEEPCWRRLPRVLAASGLEPVPIDVDADGLDVDALASKQDVRAVLISPCHQYPTGVALSPQRRAALLEWAQRVDGVILEDDYDSEFRYDRPAGGALQAAGPAHVFLYGSLSKTLAPALRLGWLVCPPHWSGEMRGDALAPYTPPTLDQLAFAAMIQSGAYDRHLRRQRVRYRRRRRLLLDLVGTCLPGVRVSGTAAGLHLLLHLPAPVNTAAFTSRARDAGVSVMTLGSLRSVDVACDDALVIGYGNVADADLPGIVRTLADLLQSSV